MRAYYILRQLFRRQGQTRFALFQRGATDPNPPRQAQVLERVASGMKMAAREGRAFYNVNSSELQLMLNTQ